MPATIAERLGAALADRYVLERELGAGGMATVWLARDLRHDRPVALKVLRPELSAVLGAERFVSEIRLTAQLDHPHILTLIDSGEADGLLWYALPYVRGESLRARLDREKQLPVDEAVRLTRQVASALAYAHERGVVHRDIKPENILLFEGEAVVTDFGIALALREAGGKRLTDTGLSIGTPQYMSPEQAIGDRDLDGRSDLYSLGAVLYELLAGDPPHTGANVQAVIAKLLSEKPTSLRMLRDTVPEALDSAVRKALAKVPADRFAGVAPFGEALGAALTATGERGSAVGRRRAWVPVLLGAVLLVAAGVWAGRTGWFRRPAPVLSTGLRTTFSGDIVGFALSPNGEQLALDRIECGDDGRCASLVEVRDVRGGVSLPLARFLATYNMRWSEDGRYVYVSAADSTGRFGTFRVASLGGPLTYLGFFSGVEQLGRTDSLLAGLFLPNGLKLGVLAPGDATLRDSSFILDAFAWTSSPDGARVAVGVRRPNGLLLRLMDRRGQTLDSLLVQRFESDLTWARSGAALFWLDNSDDGLAVTRLAVDGARGRFLGAPTHVTPPFDLPQSFAGRHLDIADDGTIAYLSGLTPRTLRLLTRTRAGLMLRPARVLARQTGRMRAFIAPDGGTVVFTRLVSRGDSVLDQLVAFDVASGVEREVSPPLENFLDASWTADGSALVYASYDLTPGTTLTRWDRASGNRRPAGIYPARVLELFWVLPDESLLGIDAQTTRAEHLAAGSAKRLRTYTLPDGQQLRVLAPAPDGARAMTMGWTGAGDSVVIGRLDLGTGNWTEITRLFAEGTGSMRWLADGQVEFVLTSTVSSSDLYRVNPETGVVTPLGELPVPFAAYNLAATGLRATAVERAVVANVYLMRPDPR